MHGYIVGKRVAPLAADGLALARGQRGEEIIEVAIAGICPVELLVGALEKALLAEELPFRLGRESDVNPRCVIDPAKLYQACGKPLAGDFGVRSCPHQEPPPSGGRERHRDLEFRIIVAARALVGLGPAAVEDILAARMALDVAGRCAEQRSVRGFDQEMLCLPPRTAANRAGVLKR